MKAKEYARRFRTELALKQDPEIILKLIFKDFVREANLLILHKKCKTPEEIAIIFDAQNNKWKDMCTFLIKYRINRNGFLELIKELEPKLYFSLIAHGLSPLPEKILKENEHGKD